MEALAVEAAADPCIASLAASLSASAAPRLPGPWRRAAYPLRQLRPLGVHAAAPDCGEAMDAAALGAKLRCALAPPAPGPPAGAGQRGCGAGGGGRAPTVPADLVVLTRLPTGLDEGDARLQATWGIDRFTYTCVRHLLSAPRMRRCQWPCPARH